MLEEIRNLTKQKLSEIRKLDYYVNSEKFRVLFSSCPDKDAIVALIKFGDFNKFLEYMDVLIRRQIEAYSIKQLRRRASSLGIKNYWALPKEELLTRVIHEQSVQRSEQATSSNARGDAGRDIPTSAKGGETPSKTSTD